MKTLEHEAKRRDPCQQNLNKITCVCSKQPLQLTEIAVALENIAPDSIIHTAIAKPEVDFFC